MKTNKKPLTIIVIVFALELILVGVLSIIFQNNINMIDRHIETGVLQDVHQVQEECRELRKTINISLAIIMILYVITTIFLTIYLSKMVIYPYKKMLESKEKKEKAEETEIKTKLQALKTIIL